jgi:hypothetical protein
MVMSNDPTDSPQDGADEQTEEVQAGSNEGQGEAESEFSAGGKNFKDLEDLRTAYTELQKDYTQKSQNLSEVKGDAEVNRRAIEEIRADPKLVEAIRKYMGAKLQQQGYNSNSESSEPTREDHRLAKLEIQFETQNLRSKYPDLTDGDVKEIYKKTSEMSNEWDADVPLSQAYVQWAWEKGKGGDAYKKGLKDKEKELKNSRSGSTAQPVSSGQKAKTKFNSKAPGGERRSQIDRLFREKGIDLSDFNK